MEGILTVQDTRQNLNNMKEWRNEAVKTVKQQTMSDNTKNILNVVCDVAKIATLAVGAVATVVAAVSPAPVLSPVVAKVSASVVGIVEGSKALLNGAPREEGVEKITASLSDLKGNIKDVSIRDKNIIKSAQLETVNMGNTNTVEQNTTVAI